jgi:transcriptional regulator with XRE-family HTH domain
LPYVRLARKVLIHKGFQGEPQTVGDHVLRKRLEDGLRRKELAARLGVDEFTLMNWELGRTKTIPARAMPGITRFLDYNPEPRPTQIGAQLRWKRRSLGWTTQEAATRNSVDQSTWEAWEKMAGWPTYPRYRGLLEEFLALLPVDLLARIRHVSPAPPRLQRRGSRIE